MYKSGFGLSFCRRQTARPCCLLLDADVYLWYPFIPRAISVTTYNMDDWHHSLGASFNLLNSRTFASLALCTFFSSMTCHSGKASFYGVYLRLWNCRCWDQTNCSLHSLVTWEGMSAVACCYTENFMGNSA